MRFSLTVCICFLVFLSIAQNAPQDQAIEVDPKTGLVDKEFPFDRSFYIKLKVDKGDIITNVAFTRVYGNGRSLEDKNGTILRDLVFEEKPIEGDNKKKYLVIEVPPLAPNSLYDILIKRKLTGKALLALFEADSLLLNDGIGTEFTKLETKENSFDAEIAEKDSLITTEAHYQFINKLAKTKHGDCGNFASNTVSQIICNSDPKTHNFITAYAKIFPQTWATKQSSPPYNLHIYKAFFDAKLKPLYDSLYSTDSKGEVKSADIPLLIADIKYLSLIQTIADLQLSNQKTRYETSMKTLSRLLSLKNADVLKWLNGSAALGDALSTKQLKIVDMEGRFGKLDESIKLLQQTIEELHLVGHSVATATIDAVNVITEIEGVVGKLKKRKSRIDKIIKTTTGLSNFAHRKFILSNTHFSKVSSEAGKWIIPDFGIVYAPSQKSKEVLRPFLGANISFGPVDKDVKTKFMSNLIAPGSSKFGRYFRQHFSLMLGVSLGTIKDEGIREDLFNEVNMMTGLSYRVGHVMRISGGTLWFNGVDPNPTISKKSIKAMGYFSISFDIEFKNASGGGLSKLF